MTSLGGGGQDVGRPRSWSEVVSVRTKADRPTSRSSKDVPAKSILFRTQSRRRRGCRQLAHERRGLERLAGRRLFAITARSGPLRNGLPVPGEGERRIEAAQREGQPGRRREFLCSCLHFSPRERRDAARRESGRIHILLRRKRNERPGNS